MSPMAYLMAYCVAGNICQAFQANNQQHMQTENYPTKKLSTETNDTKFCKNEQQQQQQ